MFLIVRFSITQSSPRMLTTASPISSRFLVEILAGLRELDARLVAALPAERDARGVDADLLVVDAVLDEDDDPLAVVLRDRLHGGVDGGEVSAAVGGDGDVGRRDGGPFVGDRMCGTNGHQQQQQRHETLPRPCHRASRFGGLTCGASSGTARTRSSATSAPNARLPSALRW